MTTERLAGDSQPNRRDVLLKGAAAVATVATATAGAQERSAPQTAVPPKTSLTGKVAVITGSARGIGRAIAVDMAAAGADIALIDIAGPVSSILEYPPATPEDLAETVKLVKQQNRRVASVVADTRDLAAMKKAAEHIIGELGHIDIVVANAGIQAFSPVAELDDAHWNEVINVNLTGTVNTVRAFLPHLIKQGAGRIIMTASGQGRHGTKDGSAYSASKWAMIGFMKSAALELGKHKITVNTFEPGLVDTPMTHNKRRWQEAISETYGGPLPENPTEAEVIKARLTRSPMGVPWMTPEQVAPVATFLASDAAALISGATYDATAGDSATYTA